MARVTVLAIALALSAVLAAQAAHAADVSEYLLTSSHDSDDSFIPHGSVFAHVVVIPSCVGVDGGTRNLTFSFPTVELSPPAPQLEQALQQSHAWAVFGADGRIARLGGLRGATQEARDFITGVTSLWQWTVPAGGEATERREREGAHTMVTTYRRLGISQERTLILSKARAFTSIHHNHAQRRSQTTLDSRVERAGQSRLVLTLDGADLISVSANDTTSFWMELPEALSASGARGDHHMVHSTLRAERLTVREAEPAELALLGDAEAHCDRVARVAASADVESMMRDADLRTTGEVAAGEAVLLEELWGAGHAATGYALPHVHHEDDIFPDGLLSPEQLRQLRLDVAVTPRSPFPQSLLEVQSALGVGKKTSTSTRSAAFTVLLEAAAAAHGYVHSLSGNEDFVQWGGNLDRVAAAVLALGKGLARTATDPAAAELERLPTRVHDDLLPFGADSDETFFMVTRFVAESVRVLCGKEPELAGLSAERTVQIETLFEMTRLVAPELASLSSSVPALAAFEEKVQAVVTALQSVLGVISDIRATLLDAGTDKAVQDAQAKAGSTPNDVRLAMLQAAAERLKDASLRAAVSAQVQESAVALRAEAGKVVTAVKEACAAGKELLKQWSKVLGGIASLVNVQLLSSSSSRSFGNPKFLRSTFLLEAEAAIGGSASSGSGTGTPGTLTEELKKLEASLDARLALEMAGFGQSGEVLALLLSPRVNYQGGFKDYRPKLRLLNMELPLSLKASALAKSLAKTVVKRFMVKLVTSDTVQRIVVTQAVKLVRRTLQEKRDLLQRGEGSVGQALQSAVTALQSVNLLADPAVKSAVEKAKGTEVGKAVLQVGAVFGTLQGTAAQLVSAVQVFVDDGNLDALFTTIKAAVASLEKELKAAGMQAGAAAESAKAAAQGIKGRLVHQVHEFRRLVAQAGALEGLEKALEAVKADATVDAVTAAVVNGLCKLNGKTCTLAAGKVTADAMRVAENVLVLYRGTVRPGMEAAVAVAAVVEHVTAGIAELLSARPNAETILSAASSFGEAVAHMEHVAKALAQLQVSVLPPQVGTAVTKVQAVFSQASKSPVVSFFKENHQLVAASVRSARTFITSVVRAVQRSSEAENGVCSVMVGIERVVTEITSSEDVKYLAQRAKAAAAVKNPTKEQQQQTVALDKLSRAVGLFATVTKVMKHGCEAYELVANQVQALSEGDDLEKAPEVTSTVSKFTAASKDVDKALTEVSNALQMLGVDQNAMPIRIVAMIRRSVAQVTAVVKLVGDTLADPMSLAQRLSMQLVRRFVVPVLLRSGVTSTVAKGVRGYIREKLDVSWLTSAETGVAGVLARLEVFLVAHPVPASAAAALGDTQAGAAVVRYSRKMAAVGQMVQDVRASLEQLTSADPEWETLNMLSGKVRSALATLLEVASAEAQLEFTNAVRKDVISMVDRTLDSMVAELSGWHADSVDAAVVPALQAVLGLVATQAEVEAAVSAAGRVDVAAVRQHAARAVGVLRVVKGTVRIALNTMASLRVLFTAVSFVAESGKTLSASNPVQLIMVELNALADAAAELSRVAQPPAATLKLPNLSIVSNVITAAKGKVEPMATAIQCTSMLAVSAYRSLRKAMADAGADGLCLNVASLPDLVLPDLKECTPFLSTTLPAGPLKVAMTVVFGLQGGAQAPSLLALQLELLGHVCKVVQVITTLTEAAGGQMSLEALESAVRMAQDEDLAAEILENLRRIQGTSQAIVKVAERVPELKQVVDTVRSAATFVNKVLEKGKNSPLVGLVASTLAKMRASGRRQPDTTLQCYADALPAANSLVTQPLFNADFTVFSVTLRTLVVGVPVYVTMGVLLNFNVRLEAGVCMPLQGGGPATSPPRPTQQYSAMAPVFEANLRVELEVGVGVPRLSVALNLRVTVLGVGLPLQTDLSLEHKALSVAIRPYLSAGGGEIKATAKVLWLSFEKLLYSWKGFRRQLAEFCWNSHPDRFAPCIVRRARVHDPGARQPGNSVLRADVSSRCFLCVPRDVARYGKSWAMACPMTPDRFDALAGMGNVDRLFSKLKPPTKWGPDAKELAAGALCGESFALQGGEWVYSAHFLAHFKVATTPPQWFAITIKNGAGSSEPHVTVAEVPKPPPAVFQPEPESMLLFARDALNPLQQGNAVLVDTAYYELPDVSLGLLADGSLATVPEAGSDAFVGQGEESTGEPNQVVQSATERGPRAAMKGGAGQGQLQATGTPQASAPTPAQLAAQGTGRCYQCNIVGSVLVCPAIGARAALQQVLQAGLVANVAELCWSEAIKNKLASLAGFNVKTAYDTTTWVLMCDERVQAGKLQGVMVVSKEPFVYLEVEAEASKCTVQDVTDHISTSPNARLRAIPQLHMRYDEQKATFRQRMGQCLPRIAVDAATRDDAAFAYEVGTIQLEPMLSQYSDSCYMCTGSASAVDCAVKSSVMSADDVQAERVEVLGLKDNVGADKASVLFKPSNLVLSHVMAEAAKAGSKGTHAIISKGGFETLVCNEFLGFSPEAEPVVFAGTLCVRKGFDRACVAYSGPWSTMANLKKDAKATVQGVTVRELVRGQRADDVKLFLLDKAVSAYAHQTGHTEVADKGLALKQRCFDAPAGVPY